MLALRVQTILVFKEKLCGLLASAGRLAIQLIYIFIHQELLLAYW